MKLYAEGLTSPEIEIFEGGTMLDNRRLYNQKKNKSFNLLIILVKMPI